MVIPSDLEDGKVVTAATYGGTLLAVNGSYDDVNRLCSELIGDPLTEDWGFVNVNLRPYYAEGSKTVGYEIAEQLGWRLPQQVISPIASGSLLTKVDKAFREFVQLGLVAGHAVPRVRRAGHGLLAGVGGVPRGPRRRAPAAAQHHRQVARDREPGRRPVRARRRTAHAAVRSATSATPR